MWGFLCGGLSPADKYRRGRGCESPHRRGWAGRAAMAARTLPQSPPAGPARCSGWALHWGTSFTGQHSQARTCCSPEPPAPAAPSSGSGGHLPMEPLETLWLCPLQEGIHAARHTGPVNHNVSCPAYTLGIPLARPCSPLNLTRSPPGGGGMSPVSAQCPKLPLQLLAQAWAQMSGHLVHQLQHV